jgi:hypothetical protein
MARVKKLTEDQFIRKLARATKERGLEWTVLSKPRPFIRCDRKCPIEVVFTGSVHAFAHSVAEALGTHLQHRLIAAADGPGSPFGKFDPVLRRKILQATGLEVE